MIGNQDGAMGELQFEVPCGVHADLVFYGAITTDSDERRGCYVSQGNHEQTERLLGLGDDLVERRLVHKVNWVADGL